MQPPDGATASITYRSPTPHDGAGMWELARDCGGLDLNSPYAYVLVGSHFADTSVLAVGDDGDLAGFVSAYVPPTQRDAVFVWQIAVDARRRGQGLGRRLLHQVIERSSPLGVRSLIATVTPSNDASRRLFRSVARDCGAGYEETPGFGAEIFPGDGHEPENHLLITPLPGRPA